MPLVVVVDRATASAAEIVAAALGENKRAKIVGTRTFGKATIQAVVPVPGGGAVKLTVAEYLTPNGRSLHGRGVLPDVTVKTRLLVTAVAVARRPASVSDEEGGPRLVACTVERRGRFLVAQPFFDEGQQLALGRRSGLAVEAGELVVVEHAGGSARVVERLGSPDHVGHVLRALLLERGLAAEWPEAALREARRAAAQARGGRTARRPARARGDHDRPADGARLRRRDQRRAGRRRRARVGAHRRRRELREARRRARRRGRAAHLQRLRARLGGADAAARALGRRLQPAPRRGAARASASRCASAPTASRARRRCDGR